MKTTILLILLILSVFAFFLTEIIFLILRGFFNQGVVEEFLFLGLFVVIFGISVYATFRERSSVFGRICWRGNSQLNKIYLTFDDGPSESFTSQILDILKKNGIKATFFLVGENISAFPEISRRIVQEGHGIGNHTYNHEVLPLKSPKAISEQILRTEEAIVKATGIHPKLFRAPHGWRNMFLQPVAEKLGYRVVGWTLGVWDTDCPGTEKIVRRCLRGLTNGCIILLHDGGGDRSQTVEALSSIIAGAFKQGFEFGSLDALLAEGRR